MIKRINTLPRLLLMLFVLLLGVSILLSPAMVWADEVSGLSGKEEVVYARLNTAGEVKSIYVVNVFGKNSTITTDYGNYTKVTNLTDSSELSLAEDAVYVPKGEFCYQGDLATKALPWLIDINYYLDGKEIAPDELGGASGKLEVRMNISKDDSVNAVFFENYALQITVALPQECCTNIVAPDATVASAGADKTLSYIVFANKDTELTFSCDVDSFYMSGIQLAGISLVLGLDDLDTESLTEDLRLLQQGIVKLDDGMIQLADGVASVRDAAQDLADGTDKLDGAMNDLSMGISEIYTNSHKLADGAGELSLGTDEFLSGIRSYVDEGVNAAYQGVRDLSMGARQLSQGMSDLYNSIAAINKGLTDEGFFTGADLTAAGSQEFSQGLKANAADYLAQANQANQALTVATQSLSTAMSGYLNAVSGYSAAQTLLGAMDESDPGYQQQAEMVSAAYQQMIGAQADYQQELQSYATAVANSSSAQTASRIFASLSENYRGLHEGITGLNMAINGDGTNNNPGLKSLLTKLVSGTKELADASEDMYEGSAELSNGVGDLSANGAELIGGAGEINSGAHELADGTGKFTSGVGELADGARNIGSGMSDLNDGMSDFSQGMDDLDQGAQDLSNGSGRLRTETSSMDEQVKERIAELIGEYGGRDFPLVSFVDERNQQVSAVQFVLLTDDIELPDSAENDGAGTHEEDNDSGILERIQKVFLMMSDFVLGLKERIFS